MPEALKVAETYGTPDCKFDPGVFFFARAPHGPGGPVAESELATLDQGGVEPRLAVCVRPEGHPLYHYTTRPAKFDPGVLQAWEDELREE